MCKCHSFIQKIFTVFSKFIYRPMHFPVCSRLCKNCSTGLDVLRRSVSSSALSTHVILYKGYRLHLGFFSLRSCYFIRSINFRSMQYKHCIKRNNANSSENEKEVFVTIKWTISYFHFLSKVSSKRQLFLWEDHMLKVFAPCFLWI